MHILGMREQSLPMTPAPQFPRLMTQQSCLTAELQEDLFEGRERSWAPPKQVTHQGWSGPSLPEASASLSVISEAWATGSLNLSPHVLPSLEPRAWPRSNSCFLCMPGTLWGPGSSATWVGIGG